jgi:hydroxyacylglutathione hydrolase
MQISQHVHALQIPFQIPVGPGVAVDRFVYVYLLYGSRVVLIDTGVAGSERVVFDYLRQTGRRPEEIAMVLVTHAHPDHIGAARRIQAATGCLIAAHELDRPWIEDVSLQARERPVPGFETLVAGPVGVDRVLGGGDRLAVDMELTLEVLHTPGHSPGSISFVLPEDGVLLTGDAIPLPSEAPIYDDVVASAESLVKLGGVAGVECLLASWDEPRRGPQIREVIDSGRHYLQRMHDAVNELAGNAEAVTPELVRAILTRAGVTGPANPLTARSLAAHLRARDRRSLAAGA